MAARIKSGCAMRRAHRNPYTGLPNFKPAQAMDDSNVMNRKLLSNLQADFSNFRKRHRLVCFVLEIKGSSTTEAVAHEAIEHHEGAILRRLHIASQFLRTNRLADQLKHIFGRRHMFPAAHGRQKGYFVAGRKW